jgi:hypothetical protein
MVGMIRAKSADVGFEALDLGTKKKEAYKSSRGAEWWMPGWLGGCVEAPAAAYPLSSSFEICSH